MENLWKGIRRADYNLYRQNFPAANLADYKAWREANPTAILKPNPEFQKEKMVAKLAEAQGLKEALGEQGQGGKAAKVPNRFKSSELQTFEQSGKIAAGRPSFNVYKKERGCYWFVGPCDTATADEIGEMYGGGKFEVRTVNQASGFEEVGPEKSFTVNVHPSTYPEQIAKLPNSAPEEIMGEDEIKEAEERGKKESAREFEIASLRAQVLNPLQTNQKDPMELFIKFLEIQKLSSAAPEIGPKKSFAEIATDAVTGIAAAVTAGLTLYKSLKTEFKPATVADAGAGIGERMLLSLAENLMTKGMAGQPAAAGQPQAPAGQPAPSEPSQKEQLEMLNELAMELAKQQAIEEKEKIDTVVPMASWILSQTGIVWGMLKKNIANSDEKAVVDFVAGQLPTLADSDFKRKWLSEVVSVVKNPKLASVQSEASNEVK